jgi:hypothetical protein
MFIQVSTPKKNTEIDFFYSFKLRFHTNVRNRPQADNDGISTRAAMHSVVDTMAFADTVTWYLLYLRFSVGTMP